MFFVRLFDIGVLHLVILKTNLERTNFERAKSEILQVTLELYILGQLQKIIISVQHEFGGP